MRDTERGGRPRAPGEPSGPWTGRVEVEELPPQAVVPRGSPRLGITGTIAVVAVVGLLAGGFGMLGGRPRPSPTPEWNVGSPNVPAPTPPRVVHVGPQITPWMECSDPPVGPPSIQLQVDGQPHEGILEAVDADFMSIPSGPMRGLPDDLGEPIEVPADVISELWIGQGACAVAWTIGLARGERHELLIPLESQANEERDPSFAAQNRFPLVLAPHEDSQDVLVAVFDMSNRIVRASWPIRIPPLPPPIGMLISEETGASMPMVSGCDVTMTLANQFSEDLNPCVDDVGDPPTDTWVLDSGKALEFRLASPYESWGLETYQAVCGRLSGPSFYPDPQPECFTLLDPSGSDVFEFFAPRAPGRWILAVSTCGSTPASRPPGINRICGTWYASIEVRE